jgi:hypothetical protein
VLITTLGHDRLPSLMAGHRFPILNITIDGGAIVLMFARGGDLERDAWPERAVRVAEPGTRRLRRRRHARPGGRRTLQRGLVCVAQVLVNLMRNAIEAMDEPIVRS